MSNDNAYELAKWMSSVANKYERSIITVIEVFNKALNVNGNIDNAKSETVNKLRKGQ